MVSGEVYSFMVLLTLFNPYILGILNNGSIKEKPMKSSPILLKDEATNLTRDHAQNKYSQIGVNSPPRLVLRNNLFSKDRMKAQEVFTIIINEDIKFYFP